MYNGNVFTFQHTCSVERSILKKKLYRIIFFVFLHDKVMLQTYNLCLILRVLYKCYIVCLLLRVLYKCYKVHDLVGRDKEVNNTKIEGKVLEVWDNLYHSWLARVGLTTCSESLPFIYQMNIANIKSQV